MAVHSEVNRRVRLEAGNGYSAIEAKPGAHVQWPLSWPGCDPQHKVRTMKSSAPNNAAASPKAAAFFSLSLRSPMKLSNKPAGVATNMVSPPRAVMGEPQPGLKTSITPNAVNEASEKERPIRPITPLRCGWSPAMTGGVFSGSVIGPLALASVGQTLRLGRYRVKAKMQREIEWGQEHRARDDDLPRG